MQKKFMLAMVIVATGLVLTAYAFTTKQTAPDQTATEQLCTPAQKAKSAHCDTQSAGECPYGKAAQQAATAGQVCPPTKECPPSSCQPKSETRTL